MKKLILIIFCLTLFMPLFAEGEKYHLNLLSSAGIYEDSTDTYGYKIELEGSYDYKTHQYIVTSKKILTLEEYNEMLNHLIEKARIYKPKSKPLYYTEFARKIRIKAPEYKDMDDLSLTKLMIKEHPIYENKVVYPMTKKQQNTEKNNTETQDSGVKLDKSKFDMTTAHKVNKYETLKDFFNPEKNIVIAIIYLLLMITFFLVYPIQILIVIIGLLFHLFKEKQTVKYLLIPYGFIFILKKIYKELKWKN